MRILFLLAFYLLLATNAFAVSDQVTALIGTSTTRAAVSADTTTAQFCLDPRATDYIFVADVTNTSGTTPTMDIKIQESDGKNGWLDVIAFTQVTTVASLQKISINLINYHRCFRAFLDVGGTTPVYAAAVKVYYRYR